MTSKLTVALAALAAAGGALTVAAPAASAAPSAALVPTATSAVASAGGTAIAPATTPATWAQVVVPEHAVIVCESATFYENYDHAAGSPVTPLRTLYRGDKVGHTRGAHPVYNGWASTQDFGPNDWGFVRIECLGEWGSW